VKSSHPHFYSISTKPLPGRTDDRCSSGLAALVDLPAAAPTPPPAAAAAAAAEDVPACPFCCPVTAAAAAAAAACAASTRRLFSSRMRSNSSCCLRASSRIWTAQHSRGQHSAAGGKTTQDQLSTCDESPGSWAGRLCYVHPSLEGLIKLNMITRHIMITAVSPCPTRKKLGSWGWFHFTHQQARGLSPLVLKFSSGQPPPFSSSPAVPVVPPPAGPPGEPQGATAPA
jgi:hypothetical protein